MTDSPDKSIPTPRTDLERALSAELIELEEALDAAKAENEQLRQAAEANKRDAERYRWIDQTFSFDFCKSTCDYWRITGESKTLNFDISTLDAAVDQALKDSSQPKDKA